MEEKSWLQAMRQTQIGEVLAANRDTERFGLSLTEEDAKILIAERQNTLRQERRAV